MENTQAPKSCLSPAAALVHPPHTYHARWARPVVTVPAAPGTRRSFEFPVAQGRQSYGSPQNRGSAQCPHWTRNIELKTGCAAGIRAPAAQLHLVFSKTHGYCIVQFCPCTVVFAKLGALKYFYLFVLASINICKHVPFYIFLAHSKPCML